MEAKKKPDPMSQATKEKGRAFVASLIDEGHDYRDMLDNFRVVIALEALSRQSNSPQRAANLVGISGTMMRDLMKLAGVKKSTVLEQSEVA